MIIFPLLTVKQGRYHKSTTGRIEQGTVDEPFRQYAGQERLRPLCELFQDVR